jgi:hypothetical protein
MVRPVVAETDGNDTVQGAALPFDPVVLLAGVVIVVPDVPPLASVAPTFQPEAAVGFCPFVSWTIFVIVTVAGAGGVFVNVQTTLAPSCPRIRAGRVTEPEVPVREAMTVVPFRHVQLDE